MRNKEIEKDYNFFENEVKKGIERLGGKRTKEYCKGCYHCKIWKITDKFIKEIEELL